jgi:hypothetical protein
MENEMVVGHYNFILRSKDSFVLETFKRTAILSIPNKPKAMLND